MSLPALLDALGTIADALDLVDLGRRIVRRVTGRAHADSFLEPPPGSRGSRRPPGHSTPDKPGGMDGQTS